MCGILGWAGSANPPFDAQRFVAALRLLSHRGPDDEGVWSAPGVILGHRRLSIVDLSHAGHQPMGYGDGELQITYNGEIYNHPELRAELEQRGRRITGGSDTGVLLAALAEWGQEALNRLNGMWAFGLWDARSRRLLVCRDRFGVKPLYFRHGAGGFAFASEPKALLSLFPAHRKVNRDSLLRFLANNELYSHDQSFYSGIHVLPPAHVAVYDPAKDTVSVTRYWRYPEAEKHGSDARAACEQFAELFEDAVRVRLRSDVRVGVTLSGGLDSTAILTAAARRGSSVPLCFTSVYGSESSGELVWARRAADKVGAELRPSQAPGDGWSRLLPQIAWHLDGPGYSPAVYPLWCLMREARESRVPVLLEGQGADEALGGYQPHAILELIDYAMGRGRELRTPAGLLRRLSRLKSTFSALWVLLWIGRELSPTMLAHHRRRVGFQSLVRPGIEIPSPTAGDARPRRGDAVGRRLFEDHSRTVLPGLLHYGDAISMAHSIESRHPFMDVRLVEWLFALPTEFKLRDGETKWVLREYLRASGQAAIGDRRDKRGYPTPVHDWLVADAAQIESRLLQTDSPLHELCEPSGIRSLIRKVVRGVPAADHHLYKLLATQTWFERCIQSVPADS